MEFRVLGVLEALDAGLPVSLGGPKQRSVLAMLLLDANRSVSTDRLVDGLWGDEPPQRAAATLQVYVSNLRKALEPDRSPRAEPTVLLTQAPGYVLAVDPEQVDLFRFERLVSVARSLASHGCVAGAAVLFREALALWREAPLADLANEPFAAFEVPRLEEARIGAIEDRIDAELALGRDVDVAELEGLVGRYPYRERFRRHLMVALYRSGRQVDALAVYQAARHVLVEELGIEPGRELREIEAAILVQDPELVPDQPAPLVAEDVALVLQAVNGIDPDPPRRRVDRRGGVRRSPSRGGGAAPGDRAGTERPPLVDGRGRRRDPGRAGTGPSRRRRHGARPAPAARAHRRGRRVPVQGPVAVRARGRRVVLRPRATRCGPPRDRRERPLYGCGRCFRQRQVVARASGSPRGPGRRRAPGQRAVAAPPRHSGCGSDARAGTRARSHLSRPVDGSRPRPVARRSRVVRRLRRAGDERRDRRRRAR